MKDNFSKQAFLSTWSALQHCRAQTGLDPLLDMAHKMSELCKPDFNNRS